MTESAPNPTLHQLVLKVHSRCDLACDHCYVYEHADQSWRSRPTVIARDIVGQVARRLAEYARDHRLETVAVVLHGGEPLLAGPAGLRAICAALHSALTPVTSLDLRIHTNGVTLNREHLEVFSEFGVRVGVSLDGDRAANDLHRLDRRGRSSYDRVLRAVGLLRSPEYRHLYQGLLCTVDIANDPVAVYDALTALEPPRIDYLLPHSTWENPPPRGDSGSNTPYADWLLKVFDRWDTQGRPLPVRTFDSVLSTLAGGPSLTEALGLAPSELAVVETDGAFEQVDSLKTAFDGAAATGYDVFRHSFEEFARHPGILARQQGMDGISETCRSCPVVESCGGGLYAHRYSAERGFDNPSVFCADLRALIEGIAERITDRALSPAVASSAELDLSQRQLDRELLAQAAARAAGAAGAADGPTGAADRTAEAADGAAWQALVGLDSDSGTAPHLATVLAHPYLRTSLQEAWDRPAALTARLMALAVAAAIRAGSELTLAWDQPEAALYLPTLGTLTLPAAGRVEATTARGTVSVRTSQGTRESAQGSAHWRPLDTLDLPGIGPVLVDDADPCRACFPDPPAAGTDAGARDDFRKRLWAAHRTFHESRRAAADPAPWDPGALPLTTVTPLREGSGLRLGDHALGALGVAVDIDPRAYARQLPRLARRARLTALREAADLHLPGTPAGRLIDEADRLLGDAARAGSPAAGSSGSEQGALDAARHALDALASLPPRTLTGTGEALVAQFEAEWRRLRDRQNDGA